MKPYVYVSPARQLHVVDDRGERCITESLPTGMMWGSWAAASAEAHSWPTWSPDGGRIASFKTSADDGTASRIWISDSTGRRCQEALFLPGQLPIYLQWAPDGERVAVVSQEADTLHLHVVRLSDGHHSTPVTGSPLFFTWTPDGIAAFVAGGTEHAKLLVYPNQGSVDRIPGTPGDFCAPVWDGSALWYVLHEDGVATVARATPGQPPEAIEQLDGLVALVGSPSGRWMARAVAPGGDGTPYRHLIVIDTQTGEATDLADVHCLAFSWLPDESGLLLAKIDSDRSLVEWHLVGLDGSRKLLIDGKPSRDLSFHLRFFEQYGQSQQLVSPDSLGFLYTGSVTGHSHEGPQIWWVPFDGSAPTRLRAGVFASFRPGGA